MAATKKYTKSMEKLFSKVEKAGRPKKPAEAAKPKLGHSQLLAKLGQRRVDLYSRYGKSAIVALPVGSYEIEMHDSDGETALRHKSGDLYDPNSAYPHAGEWTKAGVPILYEDLVDGDVAWLHQPIYYDRDDAETYYPADEAPAQVSDTLPATNTVHVELYHSSPGEVLAWMIERHGEPDLKMDRTAAGGYVPTPTVLGNREESREHDQIIAIGTLLVGDQFAHERESDGVWFSLRDVRDQAAWARVMGGLVRAFQDAGYKVRNPSPSYSGSRPVVLYRKDLRALAESVHARYTQWLAAQGSRAAKR